MSEEKKIFNKRFVHFMWDDSLDGKEGFVSDSIDSLVTRVNDTIVKTIDEQRIFGLVSYGDSEHPFVVAYFRYKFFYFDPLYNVKLAWKQGKQIQARSKGSTRNEWMNMEHPDWLDNYEYRIMPEKTWRACKDVQELKKVWFNKMPFDVLDTGLEEPLIWIRSKSNHSCTRLINGYNDLDVAIGNNWITIVELFREWEFLDGLPIGVED